MILGKMMIKQISNYLSDLLTKENIKKIAKKGQHMIYKYI